MKEKSRKNRNFEGKPRGKPKRKPKGKCKKKRGKTRNNEEKHMKQKDVLE